MAITKRVKAIKAAVVPGKAYGFDEAIKIIKSATKTTPATVLLKKAVGIASGSKRPNTEKVGKVTRKQLEDIAKAKEADLTAADLDAAVKTIAGSARSMGLVVEG